MVVTFGEYRWVLIFPHLYRKRRCNRSHTCVTFLFSVHGFLDAKIDRVYLIAILQHILTRRPPSSFDPKPDDHVGISITGYSSESSIRSWWPDVTRAPSCFTPRYFSLFCKLHTMSWNFDQENNLIQFTRDREKESHNVSLEVRLKRISSVFDLVLNPSTSPIQLCQTPDIPPSAQYLCYFHPFLPFFFTKPSHHWPPSINPPKEKTQILTWRKATTHPYPHAHA